MIFRLFNAAEAGTGAQQGVAITNLNVRVTNGVFSVSLDFGSAAFDGSPRFLEIGVKPAESTSDYSILSPRQAITSVPYAIQSLNALQVGGLPASSFLRVNSEGNAGLGVANPAPGVRLEVGGPTRISAGGSGGFVQVGTPNGETGLGVVGSNRFDLRFNGSTLKLVAGPGLGPPSATAGITINTNGNVGVGMGDPLLASAWKLEVNGPVRLHPTGTEDSVNFSTPNSELGMSLTRGDNRSDIRFDGSTLKVVAGLGGGPPGQSSGLQINTLGNVAIGLPGVVNNIRLHVKSENDIGIFGVGGFEGVHGESSHATAAGVAGFNSNTGPGVYGESRGGGYGGFFIGTVRVGSLEIAGGADLAEPFPMKEKELDKGSVVVIDEEASGHLKLSTKPYDRRVAGIISGANGINPGIRLHQENMMTGTEHVALTGRVYVRADAANGPIEPGDLLTTGERPGHAMKVTDYPRAQGAILGKAMSRLDEGTGLVLVLVTLQ